MRPTADLSGFSDLVAGAKVAGARPYQEDDFRITGFPKRDPDGCDLLLVLADGMGGHRGGAQASHVAVSTFVEVFSNSGGGVAARLRGSLEAANAAVGGCAAENPEWTGMGCTLVGCVVTEAADVHWVSVGDSPLWRVRTGGDGDGGGLDRLNADHSMRPVFEEMVRLGRMSPEEARDGGSHQLRSAVTGAELTLVDEPAKPVRLGLNDRIVLASDGMETLAPDDIRRLCGGRRTSAVVVSDLLEAVEAVNSPSQDNATAVVYHHLAAAAVRRRFERLTARTRPMRRRP